MINGQRYVIFFFIDTTYIDLNRDKARLEFRKKMPCVEFLLS